MIAEIKDINVICRKAKILHLSYKPPKIMSSSRARAVITLILVFSIT